MSAAKLKVRHTLGRYPPTSAHVALALLLWLPAASVCAEPATAGKAETADIAIGAAAAGKLAYKLTTQEELKALLGPAPNQTTKTDGGMEMLVLEYPDVQAMFARMRARMSDGPSFFTLALLVVRGKDVDIGRERQIVLRHENDLKKFDRFWGFANVSLANLDLRGHAELLEAMPFDSRTTWPGTDKLPAGFDGARLLEQGKNPGLGVRGLHKKGIDGRGVAIAIIDQPLLRNHREYADRLVGYEAIEVQGVGVQMHGSPVCSIAVGNSCGVAPAARLYYYAVPMWKPDNRYYCDAIDKIITLNEGSNVSERIRVVSISTGMFAQHAGFDRWKQTLKKAEQHGLLVLTCAQDLFSYGMLTRVVGKDPDDPNSYRSTRYGVLPNALLVPVSNRTTAGHWGPDVYTYWTEAGMSWATPYLAGLAALAYQVEPQLEAKKIVELWSSSAVKTDVGPVVNPTGFIEAVRKFGRGRRAQTSN